MFTDLDTAAGDADTLRTEAAVELLRQRLPDIADAGVPHAFPLSATGFSDVERESLLAQSKSLHDRYETVKSAYVDKLASVNAAGTKPPQKLTLLTEMARAFLGEDFALLPRFTITDAADVIKADANRDQLLKYARDTRNVPLPVDEWLHGVSLVRPSMHTFATVLMLSQTFNHDAPECSPLQLPFRDNDSWLGIEFPEGTAIVHDTIAMLQCVPQGFQPAATQTGLLIDEWTEALPQKEEVTGIAFNYDQPNSAPPSAILLAVTPEITGKWNWNNLTDTVLETIERAKLRAVEPDMIDTMGGFCTLLPTTISGVQYQPKRNLSRLFIERKFRGPGSGDAFRGVVQRVIYANTFTECVPDKCANRHQLVARVVSRPAITAYNRLEPRARTENFARSLRAEIRDPLWMLTRQWQMGEFEAEDAGSAIDARLLTTQAHVDRIALRGANGRQYDLDVPPGNYRRARADSFYSCAEGARANTSSNCTRRPCALSMWQKVFERLSICAKPGGGVPRAG